MKIELNLTENELEQLLCLVAYYQRNGNIQEYITEDLANKLKHIISKRLGY